MYTAGKFEREVNRIFLAISINHIRYLKDAYGSSGTMLSFGPSKAYAYYFIEKFSSFFNYIKKYLTGL